ncbi:MAG: hypothetical protein JJT78_03275 [Leptospira sp.]|nr:hypothetical protein [Leptospira sp.]
MDSKTRSQLIREGNAAFNDRDIRKARELFLKTDYKDGLVRLGDYFMYDRNLPMLAFGYYKKAGMQSKVDEIFQRMIFALSTWIGRDKFKSPSPQKPANNSEIQLEDEKGQNQINGKSLNPDDFRVHPILKAKALEILANQSGR